MHRRLPLKATTLLLTLTLAGAAATSCSPAEHPPLAIAFAGTNYAPDSSGLADMMRQTQDSSPEEQKASLRMFADRAGDAATRQKANYALARLLMRGEKAELEESVKRFRDAAQLPSLFTHAQNHITEIGATLADEKIVQEALKAIADNQDLEPADRAGAFYGLGQSCLRTNDHEAARKYFQSAQKVDSSSQFALGASYYLTHLELHPDGSATTGNTALTSCENPTRTAAIEVYRHYLAASPDGRFAEDIITELQNMDGFALSAHDHELFANAFYEHKHWQSASNEWRKAGDTSQWYKQGLALLRAGQAKEGRALLVAGIQNHPNDEVVEDAASTLSTMSNRQGASAVWSLVAQRSSRFADVALWNLAIRADTHPASLAYYKAVVTRYPTSRYAAESAWWLCWEEIKAGKGAQALPKLQAAVASYASSRAGTRFAFWIGKIQERLGKKQLAKAAYQKTIAIQPWSYYAYRAQQRLNALSGGRDEGWSTNPQRQVPWAQDDVKQWQWPEAPAQLAKQHGETVATLNEIRQFDECLELIPKDKGLLRSFYLAKLNQPLPAINAAVPELSGKPTRSEVWELAYPLLYGKQIAREGPSKQVDPLLVQALIREESRYNYKAVSSSNALGLMQLLPGTAYGVAKRLGLRLYNTNDIHEPAVNIKLGTDYLGYVHRRHNNNSLFAVASYNGGPNAVAKWVKTMPADTDVFVESIPYRETRDYVRKVFGSYWNYRAIYTPKIE